MTPTLRWLVWLAVLIGLWSVALEWEQEVARLKPEKQKLEQIRQREGSALQSVDWKAQELLARHAQIAWLDRLPEVSQVGLFRAEAMETISDLCGRLDASCQIASMGETQARGPTATTQGATANNLNELKGLVTTTLRVTVGLSGNKLLPLMQEIEQGKVLRKIERFTVRSGRAELIVKIFGLESNVARGERAAALRHIEQITLASSSITAENARPSSAGAAR